MTNTNELFNLCKKVYAATGWHQTGVLMGQSERDDEGITRAWYPIYTSDYLLEKLPPVVQDSLDKKFRHIQMWINGDGEARACYVEPYDTEFRGTYAVESDTPLKALLKLTLKLHEEKLL